jgi:SNF2 family DNA or RNA helicase
MGALLADDMGLGKTLQAMTVMRGRVLVVCPTSVLYGWEQQLKLFRPALSVSRYHGSTRQLKADAAVTLTTYAVLRLDIESLSQIEWDTIVLDESQTIKNPESQVARAAYRLRGGFKINLSGTPVENSLEDLWSQFHFLNPGLLGTRASFSENVEQAIRSGDRKAAERLKKQVAPFILRRMKRDVAKELPPKTEVVLECELSSEERVVYDSILAACQRDVVEKLKQGVAPSRVAIYIEGAGASSAGVFSVDFAARSYRAKAG